MLHRPVNPITRGLKCCGPDSRGAKKRAFAQPTRLLPSLVQYISSSRFPGERETAASVPTASQIAHSLPACTIPSIPFDGTNPRIQLIQEQGKDTDERRKPSNLVFSPRYHHFFFFSFLIISTMPSKPRGDPRDRSVRIAERPALGPPR